jgi:uncharacterized protein
MTMTDGSLLEFPCELPIKVFGRNDKVFRDEVLGILRGHYGDLDAGRISEQLSRQGSYLSITATVVAASREQIDSVYRELTASAHVLMVL